ncbi:MAG: GspH/FimT family pseudopilin [Legionella sp.]
MIIFLHGRGFTLIELLIAICIFLILTLIAVPSFNKQILDSRLTANVHSLVNSLHYARNLALNNNTTITICPFSANNSVQCGNDWTNGWIVITQPSSDAPTLLKSEQNLSEQITVKSLATRITFNSQGVVGSQSNFTLCDTRGSQFARSLTIMASGFIQSGNVPGQSVWNSAPLTCP